VRELQDKNLTSLKEFYSAKLTFQKFSLENEKSKVRLVMGDIELGLSSMNLILEDDNHVTTRGCSPLFESFYSV